MYCAQCDTTDTKVNVNKLDQVPSVWHYKKLRIRNPVFVNFGVERGNRKDSGFQVSVHMSATAS